jgi:hypothetical protein
MRDCCFVDEQLNEACHAGIARRAKRAIAQLSARSIERLNALSGVDWLVSFVQSLEQITAELAAPFDEQFLESSKRTKQSKSELRQTAEQESQKRKLEATKRPQSTSSMMQRQEATGELAVDRRVEQKQAAQQAKAQHQQNCKWKS